MRTPQKSIFFRGKPWSKNNPKCKYAAVFISGRWRLRLIGIWYGLQVFNKDRIILLTRNGKTQHTRYSNWWLKWWRREVIVLEDRLSLYRSATKEQTKISYGGRVSHMTEISRLVTRLNHPPCLWGRGAGVSIDWCISFSCMMLFMGSSFFR